MTPDLPTRVREALKTPAAHEAVAVAIAGAYGEPLEDWHRDAAPAVLAGLTNEALAAVIAVVQEDRTREIVAWLQKQAGYFVAGSEARVERLSWAQIIEREFGGTTHD